MTVVKACNLSGGYEKAKSFVEPEQKFCCHLMQKILSGEDDVYLVIEKDESVRAVFAFTKGNLLLPCLPYSSKEILESIKSFLADKKIFCLAGKKSHIKLILKILPEAKEIRNFIFMQLEGKTEVFRGSLKEIHLEEGIKIKQCSIKDADLLFPLHIGYMKEEVLPKGRELYLPTCRTELEKLLKEQIVFAVECEGIFAGKVNADLNNGPYAQLGGVYTLPAFRNRGFASSLIVSLSKRLLSLSKTPVLFVNKNNPVAQRVYRKCGYRPCGKYCICYFSSLLNKSKS